MDFINYFKGRDTPTQAQELKEKEKEIIQLKNDKGAIRFKLENKEIEIRKLRDSNDHLKEEKEKLEETVRKLQHEISSNAMRQQNAADANLPWVYPEATWNAL